MSTLHFGLVVDLQLVVAILNMASNFLCYSTLRSPCLLYFPFCVLHFYSSIRVCACICEYVRRLLRVISVERLSETHSRLLNCENLAHATCHMPLIQLIEVCLEITGHT